MPAPIYRPLFGNDARVNGFHEITVHPEAVRLVLTGPFSQEPGLSLERHTGETIGIVNGVMFEQVVEVGHKLPDKFRRQFIVLEPVLESLDPDKEIHPGQDISPDIAFEKLHCVIIELEPLQQDCGVAAEVAAAHGIDFPDQGHDHLPRGIRLVFEGFQSLDKLRGEE